MTSTPTQFVTQIVTLQHDSPVPLFRQLYYCLRDGILAGQLTPGAQLPSTRLLALDLGVARITVQNAYEQLAAEGYAEGRHGSGTYVAMKPPAQVRHLAGEPSFSQPRTAAARRIAQRGVALMQTPRLGPSSTVERPSSNAFRIDVPALEAFPSELWGRLLGRRWRASGGALLDYQQGTGYPPLRAAIADYLTQERGVRCTADQVIIVAGAQQGIDLAVRVLLDPGDKAWIEDPGYPGVYGVLASAGGQLCPVPVDQEGLNVAGGMLRYPEARLAVVTPAHQVPTGVTMSLNRRLALLEWAYRAGAWILEDDYDGEYRYGSRPFAPLQGLDQGQCVLYLGSFSKVLFPALRIGYLVAPPDLVEPLVGARLVATQHPPLLEQAVLADFIAGGHLTAHVRRTRSLYQDRKTALEEACQQTLANLLALQSTETGTQLVGWLPAGIDDQAVAVQAAVQGIEVVPLSAYRFTPGGRAGLRLGYAATDLPAIHSGVQGLARALKSVAHR